MGNFKNTIRKRLKFYSGVIGLFTLLLGGNVLHWFNPVVQNQHYVDFFSGFQFGLLIGIEIFLIFRIGYYTSVLKDEKKLRDLYIKENDERTLEIGKRCGCESYKYVIVILFAAAIIVGYFSVAGFIAIMGAALVEVLVRAVLYIYYSKTI